MNRRFFMASAAALIAAPKVLFAAEGTIDYEPGLIQAKLEAGETVFVDYAADWCGTCKRQERVINELRAANPDYDQKITFVRVDWDMYGSHEVASSRGIFQRSTLLMLRGEEELGRVESGTSTGDIQALLDTGLVS